MTHFEPSLFGSIYIAIYGAIFIGFCISIYCYPRGYKMDNNDKTKFMIFNIMSVCIEALLTSIMIIISFFVEYQDNKLMILTMTGFYHYVIFTLPYYKSYLLMKYLKWMQWSLLCDFIILESDHSFNDMINRFYCCLHQFMYHNRDNMVDEEIEDTENINLLIQHKSINNNNPNIHKRNSKKCIKLQFEFMSYSINEKWIYLKQLLDKIKSMQSNHTKSRYYEQYKHWNEDPFHSNIYINYIYWISSVISLFFPFIWMPFIGDELYFQSGFYMLCSLIAIFELLLIFTIWYLFCILKFNFSVFRMAKILNNYDETQFYNDDYFIALNMNNDMNLIYILLNNTNIQIDIAYIILLYSLETTCYGIRPRKNTIY